MSEKNSGYLGSAVVFDIKRLDLSQMTHAESMAEMIAVLQLASGGSFENRSQSVSQVLFPYILTRYEFSFNEHVSLSNKDANVFALVRRVGNG